MTTSFTEIDAQEVKNSFPEFYYEGGKFFEIIHKGKPFGIIGMTDIGVGYCNLGFYIHPELRNSMSKELILDIADFPCQLGFKVCLFMTLKTSILKLLHRMQRYGIKYCGKSFEYFCYYKEYEV